MFSFSCCDLWGMRSRQCFKLHFLWKSKIKQVFKYLLMVGVLSSMVSLHVVFTVLLGCWSLQFVGVKEQRLLLSDTSGSFQKHFGLKTRPDNRTSVLSDVIMAVIVVVLSMEVFLFCFVCFCFWLLV